jgi:adenylate cyclase
MLLVDETGSALYAIAGRGFDQQNIGAEVVLGDGPIGGPLARCELQRSTGLRQLGKYSRTVRASFEAYGVRPGADVPVPTLSDVNSRIVVPMRALGQLVGGLVVEDRALAAFDDTDEQVLAIAAAMLGNAIEQARRLDVAESDDTTAGQAAAPTTGGEPRRSAAAGCAVRCFELDGSVFLDGEYLIKGVAGRILRSLVAEHLASGRTAFSNRELRLDQTLDLPGFKDNLESRLLLLQRRLDEREAPLRIVKTGRGKFELDVRAVLTLETVETTSA